MPSLQPKDETTGNDPRDEGSRIREYNRESTGLLIIAILILVVTLLRYWHSISWSVR